MSIVPTNENTSSKDWDAYSSYNNTLRAWFVAFGVGVPATFLVNQELIKYISPTNGDPSIVIYFLIGAGAQVLMAFLNKTINWCNYYKDTKFNNSPTGFWQCSADFFAKASNWYVIDFFFDIVTIGFFSYALWELFNLILNFPLNK
jgi:hypothetical protein